ncbi:MAG: thioredoxin fold domain-containing protein [Bacteroidales bacterium]|nr:thioredoxin fold domain-containing protein [Bacteroidales bacterium]
MKKKIIIAALFFAFSGLQVFSQKAETLQLSSKEFKNKIESGNGVLLDVRTQREFENGHLEDAGQLNYYALDFRRRLLLLPKDQPIYLYCNTGYRSDRAASFLVSNGYTQVYNLQHGIMEWELAELPVIVEANAMPDLDDKFEPAEFAALIKENELVFIDFYAPWCGPCRQMMPMIDSLKVEYHERIPIVKVNADASKRLMREYKIVSVPYLVMYQNGEMIFEHKGIIDRKNLIEVLDAQL